MSTTFFLNKRILWFRLFGGHPYGCGQAAGYDIAQQELGTSLCYVNSTNG